MYGFIHCDRCGKKDPAYQRYYDYYNCAECEKEYQVGLWFQDYHDQHGWTEAVTSRWNELFRADFGISYDKYQKQYAEYRNG